MNGSVNAFYSTPSLYVDEKKRWNGSYETRADDIFPLADNSHNYWSGFFTSRPALKRQVRFATNVLMAARQLEVYTKTAASEVPVTTAKHSPVVGTSWTDSFEGTIGVATHHDGMSGTERQDVTDDYAMRISTSQKEVEAGVAVSLAKLLHIPSDAVEHCHCHVTQECLNISVCAATAGRDAFTIAAWNPLAHATSQMARIPVTGPSWTVTVSGEEGAGAGVAVPSQLVPLDNRTLELPLLYLNTYKMNATQIDTARRELANPATHALIFEMRLPPLGLATFSVRGGTSRSYSATTTPDTERGHHALGDRIGSQPSRAEGGFEGAAGAAALARPTSFAVAEDVTVQSDRYALTFDGATGMLSSITNRQTNSTTPLAISWGWYNSSVGGCTEYSPDVPKERRLPPCSGQHSGAYIFRPNSSAVFYPGPRRKPTIEVVHGPLVTEVRQSFSEWASHVIRLYEGRPYVEVEWTAGPIPVDTPWFAPAATDPKTKKGLPNLWGKEVIIKYASGLRSGQTWYSDSNGKEMVQRRYNKRGPSYPHDYNISEPVAGNCAPPRDSNSWGALERLPWASCISQISARSLLPDVCFSLG